MTESWRSVGGTQSYQQLNNITTNSIYTDTLTVKQSYLGQFVIDGFLKVTDNVFFSKNLYLDKDLFVYGNTYLANYVYLGSNNKNYLYGNDTGIGVNVDNPTSTLEIFGDDITTFKAKNSQNEVKNYPALTSELNGISLGGNTYSSYIYFYNSGQATSNNENPDMTLISMNGNLYVEPDYSTIIRSRMIVSNKAENPKHLGLENFTIYDTPTTVFRYDLYGNLLGTTGISLTGVAGTERSTTFVTLNASNNQGFGIGGGIVKTTGKSVGILGTYNVDGVYTIAQTMISSPYTTTGNEIVKKVAVGFNNVDPEYGKYILDINGPVHVRMAEINNQYLSTFEFKAVTFCESNSKYAIAVGSPIEDGLTFKQYIAYSHDGGLSWTTARVKETDSTDDLEDSINYFYAAYFQSPEFAVIAGNSNYMYYSTDYGVSWTKYTYLYDYKDFVIEDVLQTVTTTSLFVKENVVFGVYENETPDYTFERGFFAYIPDPSGGTVVDGGYSERYKINTLYNSDLNFVNVTGYGDYLYFLATSDLSGSYLFIAQFDYSTMNFVYEIPTSYTNFSGATFRHHHKSAYGEFLVGDKIYYKDTGDDWVESSYRPATGVYLNHIAVMSKYNAVAVGTNGLFIYTKDGGETWNVVSPGLLNSYGNASVLIDSALDLLHIQVLDDETFLISYAATAYSYLTTTGESKIYHVYIPTLFNRANTFLMDICGSTRITGDLRVDDGGDTFLDGSLFVRGAVEMNDTLSIGGDETNKDYYISIGSIANPTEQISQATLALQGQNGLNNFNIWKIQVGTTKAANPSYDTTRLRFVDETNAATERMTIDTNGCVGIATTSPQSTLDVSGILTISDATQSTAENTGALQVRGGVSISKNVYIGGRMTMFYIEDSVSTATGSIQTDGGLGIGMSSYIGGNLIVQSSVSPTSSATGAFVLSAGGAGIAGSVFTGGNVTIQDATAATSTTTGAFIVAGGSGITGSIFMGGNVTIQDQTSATSMTTGALIVAGGAGITGSVFTGGNVTIQDQTSATSTTTGAFIVAGGVGITGDVYIGQTLNTAGVITSNTGIEIGGTETNTNYYMTVGSIADPTTQISQGTVAIQGQNGMNNYNIWKFQVGTDSPGTSSYDTTRLRIVDETNSAKERVTIDTYGYVGIWTTTPSSALDVNGVVTIEDETATTSTTTGALVLTAGGAAIAGSIFTGGNVTIQDSTAATSPTTGAFIVAGGVAIAGSIFTGGNVTIQNTTAATSPTAGALVLTAGGAAIAGSIFTGGNVTIQNTTAATSPTTGALVLTAGGAAIAGSIFTGGNVTIQDSTDATALNTGALQVRGGASISGTLYVGTKLNTEEIDGTSLYITGTTSGTEYTATIGSIADPASQISQGTVKIQGQNGMENYSAWNISVGTVSPGTSSYDTSRLTVEDAIQGEERLTIDMYGYVGIGTSSPTATLHVCGTALMDGDYTLYGNIITSNSTYISNTALGYLSNITSDVQAQIDDIVTDISSVQTATTAISYSASSATTYIAGNAVVSGTLSAANYSTTSDYRIKENILPLNPEFTSELLRPVSYYNKITNKYDIGLIAHEVQEVYPFMVTGEKDGDEYQSVNYRHVLVAMMNDIRELRAEIAELKASAPSQLRRQNASSNIRRTDETI